MIVQRGERMGLDFQAEIEALKAVDWEREIQAVQDPSVQVGSRGGEVMQQEAVVGSHGLASAELEH
jgi:hypothetical protein